MKRRRLFSYFFLTLFFLFMGKDVAFSLPTGYQTESGEVSFDASQEKTLVVTASDQAIVNFDSFSIAQDETVRFIQSGESASVLSRVTGAMQSDIYGNLFANGQLVLVNPNGIHFTIRQMSKCMI